MVFEKLIDLAVHDQVGAPEIQELLPLGVAVADHPGVRPTVKGVCRINHGGPALVALGEQQHVAVAADPGVGAEPVRAKRADAWISGDSDVLLIQASARFARTGSAPSVICPLVVITFGPLGNRSGMRGSPLAPVVTEMMTFGSLRSAAVLKRSALSL